jgi:hypothetical protein
VRCQSPAMPNGRCRLHGGKSPGTPRGNKNAFKHGRYSAETIQARRPIAGKAVSTSGCHVTGALEKEPMPSLEAEWGAKGFYDPSRFPTGGGQKLPLLGVMPRPAEVSLHSSGRS